MSHEPKPPFFAYAGSRSPRIVFCGEAFGADEEACGRPFIGAAGRELLSLLGEAYPHLYPDLYRMAWKHHHSPHFHQFRDEYLNACGFGLTNVFAFRPPNNSIPLICVSKKELPNDYKYSQIDTGKYIDPAYIGELGRLSDELSILSPILIVPLGNVACWAIFGSRGIGGFRGTVKPEELTGLNIKSIATFHPSAVLHNYSLRPIVLMDLGKILRESEFKEIRRPVRYVTVNPQIDEVEGYCAELLKINKPISADVETSRGQITHVGFGKGRDSAISIPFRNVHQGYWHSPINYWENIQDEIRAWICVERVLSSEIVKLFQNGLYDIQYFMKYGFRVINALEDTMLLHHSIYPEMQKGLGFMGSIYTSEPAWKLMRHRKGDESVKADE